MLETITRLLKDEPEILHNMQRTNAILLDLAPENPRERILVRSFVEIGGLERLQNAASYALAEKKLLEIITQTFCMEPTAALWVVRLFGVAMGLVPQSELPALDEKTGAFSLTERVAETYLAGQVAIGKKHVVAISADSTLFAGGDNADFQCDVIGWRDIVAVAAGESHTLGLSAGGKVFATGSNEFDECDIGHLSDVRAVYAFGNDSVCVLKDGTVQAFGQSKFDLSTFSDIKTIARYPEGLIGVKNDGTLSLVGSIADDEAALEIQWLLGCRDVEQVISTYNNGCVILGRDRRIYKDNQPESYFAQWRDIISIVDLADSFAILRADGTVRVLPYERGKPRPETSADTWENIAAIYGGYKRLIGLTRDGNLQVAYTHQGWLWSNQNMKMDYVANWYPVGIL